MVERYQDKIARVLSETVALEEYDPAWPERFEEEKRHLQSCLPGELVRRIEHFGSTAIPGLCAKPIIDILIEVTNLTEARRKIIPLMEQQGYEYFWRPSFGNDIPPYYAWFIKRDEQGNRTHHIHMLESHFRQWEGLLFRDYLIEHPLVAEEYGVIKTKLSATHRSDRVAYTREKGTFIRQVTKKAISYYRHY